MKLDFRIPLTSIVCFCFSLLFAQKTEIGVSVGASSFYGDINYGPNPNYSSYGLGGVYRKRHNDYLVSKTFASITSLNASDANSKTLWQSSRNLHFFTNIVECSQQLEINYFAYDKTKEDMRLSPYAFFGLGVLHFSPKVIFEGVQYDLRLLGTEGQNSANSTNVNYNPIKMFFVFGGGMKWSMNKHWSINLEIGLRRTNTDYLDDIGGVYPNEDLVMRYNPDNGQMIIDISDPSFNQQIGVDGKQRSSSKRKDAYLLSLFHITYTINRQSCPMVYN